MRPVDQTLLHSDTVKGNCFTACMASIFEIPIDEMPNFYCFNWIKNLSDFVKSKGYDWDYWDFEEYPKQSLPETQDYIIVVGDSPRGHSIGHAVVYQQGVMVHDPHPDKTGIGKLRGYWEFTRHK